MSQESRRRAWEKKQQRLEAERRKKKELAAAQLSAVSLSIKTPLVSAKNDVMSANQNSSKQIFPAKPKQNPLDRWQSLVARITAIWKPISAVVVAVAGITAVYAFLTPSLEISPGVIPNESNAVSAEFNVKNNGHVTVYENVLTCAVHSAGKDIILGGNGYPDPVRQKSQYIDQPAPGESATRPCGPDRLIVLPFPSAIGVAVNSHWGPWAVLWWNSGGYFTSLRDATGHNKMVPDRP